MDAWWQPALAGAVDGRDVILAGAAPAAWTDLVAHLRSSGANRIMVVATEGPGVGRGPDVRTVVVSPPAAAGMMARVRFGIDALRTPPVELVNAVREFDPDRTALVVGTFLNEAAELDGRPFLAHRRPEWLALEDKTVVDAFWDRAGVARLDAAVVPLAEAADAARSLDAGSGTVWAADARDGFHGGAHLTRWVADAVSRERAVADLGPVCDRVRVMPFVDGLPCSIHGIVMDDGAAVLRPVEMVTLRRDHDLVYAGCSTFWDPPADVRVTMRDVARRTGARLRDEVGFRGTFTVDGVVDGDTFWPTELNPRFGAGINVIARASGNPPLPFIHDLIVGGHDIGITAADLERELLAHADAHRGGGTWTTTSPGATPTEPRGLGFDGLRWRWADADSSVEPAGTVAAGSGFARCTWSPAVTPVGRSVAPRAAAFWRFADTELATGLGPLVPAPDPFA